MSLAALTTLSQVFLEDFRKSFYGETLACRLHSKDGVPDLAQEEKRRDVPGDTAAHDLSTRWLFPGKYVIKHARRNNSFLSLEKRLSAWFFPA